MEVADLHLACLFCTQNCYRTHGEDKPPGPTVPAFCKIMTDTNVSKDTIEPVLELPFAFVKEYKHQLDRTSILEGPSGQNWSVGVCGSKYNMSFKKGWHTFSTDHDLCEGDIVIFKLITKAYLTVQVFNKDGCEKDLYSVQNSVALALQSGISPTQNSLTKRMHRQLKHEKVANVADVIMESKECTPNFENGHKNREDFEIILDVNTIVTENTQRQNFKEPSTLNLADLEFDNIDSLQNSVDRYKNTSVVMYQENVKCNSMTIGTKKTLSGRRQSCDTRSGVLKTRLNEANISCVRLVPNVIVAANSHHGIYPTAIVQMKHSHVSHGFSLSMGKKFGKKWLPTVDTDGYLVNSAGYRWQVKWLPKRVTFSAGWARFVFDHGLQEDDVCLFELTTETPFTFNVYMFRCSLRS